MAQYDYDAADDAEVSFREGDVVQVTQTDTGTPGWWQGTVNGKSGLLPKDYVSATATSSNASNANNASSGGGKKGGSSSELFRANALFDYSDPAPTSLNFAEGETLAITSESVEDDPQGEWYYGHVVGDESRAGEFPRNFVERI